MLPVMTKPQAQPSMKVPPKRKGNADDEHQQNPGTRPSMKVPPKRKGNYRQPVLESGCRGSLNESPSEKEGKWSRPHG